ncbi:conserved Plasmodium protein, unknown function [Plasmodium vivax]|uniref:RNA-binding protein n=1 Tax=Plasmodium vivax TaxID=5855 RepID=A0A1G4GXV1_PLAVI|nr:conserved Plasmodium protein, unknown function [Plasmodium vivax]
MKSGPGVNTPLRDASNVNTPLRDHPEDTQNQDNDTPPFGKKIERIEKLKINSISTGVDSHRSSEKSASNRINLGGATPYAPGSFSKQISERDDGVETLSRTEGGAQGDNSTETNEQGNYKIKVLSLGECPIEGGHLEGHPTSGSHPSGETPILGKNPTDDFPHMSDAAYKSKEDDLLFSNLHKLATSQMGENCGRIFPFEYNLEQLGMRINGAIEANLWGHYGGDTLVEEEEEEEEEPIRGEHKRGDISELTKQHCFAENVGDTSHQDSFPKWGDKQAVEDTKRGSEARGTNEAGSSGGGNPDWGMTLAQNGPAEMSLLPYGTTADLLTPFFPPPGRSHLLRSEVATAVRTHVGKFEAPLREEIPQQAQDQNYFYDLRTNRVWVPGEGPPPRGGATHGMTTYGEATHRRTTHGEAAPVEAATGTIIDQGLPPFGIFPNESEVGEGFHGEGRTPKLESPNVKMMEYALLTRGTQEFPPSNGSALPPFYAHHGTAPVQEKEEPQRGAFTDEKETYMQHLLEGNSIFDPLWGHHKEEEMATSGTLNGGNQSVLPTCFQFDGHLRESYEEDDSALQRGDNWGRRKMESNTNLMRLTQLEEALLSERNLYEASLCQTEGVDLTNLCNLVGGERQDGEVAHSYHFAPPVFNPYDDSKKLSVASGPNTYDYCCADFLLNYAVEEGRKKRSKKKTLHDDGFTSSSDQVLPQECDRNVGSMDERTEEGNQKGSHSHHGENFPLSKRFSKSSAKYTLIVNVPSNTTRKDLLAVFSKFGNVDLTMVVCDKKSRHPNKEWTATSGYAFVRFSTNLEAQRTLNAACAGGIRIRGSRVRATWAKKDSYSKREKEVTLKIPSSILLIRMDEFICSICKINLSYEPILLPCCYASCCSDCLRGYLVVHALGENIRCPSCSVHLADGLIKIDEHSPGVLGLLYRIHSNVKIKCQHESCTWVGSQHQYANHFFSCKFALA